LDRRHAIEIDPTGEAYDPDDGGVAAENFSTCARRVRANEPLSLLDSTDVPMPLDFVPSMDFGADWFGLSALRFSDV
jgi:hypothetical protein